jgi:SagB-type dehydrogenase family enzyme
LTVTEDESATTLRKLLAIDNWLERSKPGPLDEEPSFVPRDFSISRKFNKKGYKKIDLGRPDLTLAREPYSRVVARRRSCREMDPETGLSIKEMSTLLYLTCGTSATVSAYGQNKFPLFVSPSTGGLHSCEIYVAVARSDEIPCGFHYYDHSKHRLILMSKQESYPSAVLVDSTPGQWPVKDAPTLLIFGFNLERGMWKYRDRFYKFGLIDVGVTAQSAHMAATALGLCSCMFAGFEKERLAEALELEQGEVLALLMTVGHNRSD